MKIIAVSSSPRENSNCDIIIDKVLQGIKKSHNEVQFHFVKLSKLDIEDCRGCYYCKKNIGCIIQDDMQDIYKKLYDADVLIFASPIYMGHITGNGKKFIDRFFSLSSGEHEVNLPMGKKVVTILTQGHLREEAYRDVMDSINRIFNGYGFETVGRIIEAGAPLDPNDAKKEVMDVAYSIGERI